MSVYKKEYFKIARKIVSNMTSESWEQIPHTTASYEADVTELMKYYKKLNEGVTDPADKITVNTLALKIICEGLKAAPKMNTTLAFSRRLVRGTLRYHDTIDISMPMILKTGEMMTVNMHDMGNKSLLEMTHAIADTVRRANNSDMNEVMFEVPVEDRLTKHDIEQGTTTISNLGSVYTGQKGECFLLEIIPPQTTAFAVNAIQDRPAVVTDGSGNKKIEIRQIMPITVAIDHRALDYGDCVPFFKRLDEIFAAPQIILTWRDNRSSVTAEREKYTASENVRLKSRTAF